MEYSKLTERAQVVILEAEGESEKFKHGYVGTEHILLGILKENGYWATLLKKHGIYLENIREMLQRYLGYGDITKTGDDILLTPRTKRLLDESFSEAKKLDHRFVGTRTHIACISGSRRGNGLYYIEEFKIKL